MVTQAIWAVDVAREASRRVSQQPDEGKRLGAMIRQVHNPARSRAGRQILREHGIEVLDALPIEEIRAVAPVHEPQLRAIERAMVARAAGLVVGRSDER